MLKLLIADSDEEFTRLLALALGNEYRIHCCTNGRKALKILLQEEIDILVLDMMMPELDGISLLRKALEDHLYPMVLATTPLCTEYIVRTCEELGVDYLIRKPCSVQAAVERIHDLRKHLKPLISPTESLRRCVAELLFQISVPVKLSGYRYLQEAIVQKSAESDSSMTKDLYPAVAKLFDKSPAHVERCIRTAIRSAWMHRDDAVWLRYFPPEHLQKAPSNALFITRMVMHAVWMQLER